MFRTHPTEEDIMNVKLFAAVLATSFVVAAPASAQLGLSNYPGIAAEPTPYAYAPFQPAPGYGAYAAYPAPRQIVRPKVHSGRRAKR
jgi:hypothetical protein